MRHAIFSLFGHTESLSATLPADTRPVINKTLVVSVERW